MADGIEEKWPKGVVSSLLFLFILIGMLATMAPVKLIDRVMETERRWGNALMAEQEMTLLLKQTDRIYTALVIDSGVKEAVNDVFMPRGGTVDAFEEKVGWWFTYLEGRGVALQKIVYQMVYRVVLMLYWLPFFVAVLLPAVYAGWMRWHAKRNGFDYSSPFLNNNSLLILSWSMVGLILSVFLPLPLPPLLVATVTIILLPVLITILIRNLPKRI